MLIEEKALQHWLHHFFGYGSWKAKCWFVAYEEGGGDTPEEVGDKLNYFYKEHTSNTPALCNIRQLYQQVSFRLTGPREELFNNLFDYRFGKDAVQHGTWKNLIAFEHGYLQQPAPDLLTYQQNSWLMNDSEALLRLYPLPAHNHAWYYSWLDMPNLPFLKSRAAYQEHVYPTRMEYLLHNMKEYKPEVVVMYGMNNIERLKQSVKSFYPDVQFKRIKAIPRQIPSYHRADLPDTTLLITTQIPALRHNRIETGFDWEALGKIVSW